MYYIERSNGFMSKAAETLIQLLYPMSTYCVCCGKYIDSSRSYCICDHCIKHITWGHIYIDLEKEASCLGRRQVLDSARACMKYGLYERRLIFDLKYDGLTYISRVIASIMYDRIMSDIEAARELKNSDYIIPVPLHREKERLRGFNQAEKISLHLAKRLGIKELPDALVRQKYTAAQRSIEGQERYFNLEGAFIVNPKHKERLKGKAVILIDDVYTTGATAYRCGTVLKEAGVKRMDFMSLATSNDFAYGFSPLKKSV